MLDRNDSPPRFAGSELEITVSEEVGVGAVVGSVEAVDPDEGASVSYSLVPSVSEGADASSDIDSPFSLDHRGTFTLTSPLDREIKDTYRLGVRASDGLQAAHTTLVIKVNLFFAFYKYFTVGRYRKKDFPALRPKIFPKLNTFPVIRVQS